MASEKPDALQILREHGLKATTQRLAILDIVMEEGLHPTAEEVHERLREEHPTVSLSTVYDTLARLSELGVIDPLHPGDGVTRYEFFNDPHVNVVCPECREVVDVDTDAIGSFLAQVRSQTDQDIVDQPIKLRGFCRECGPRAEV